MGHVADHHFFIDASGFYSEMQPLSDESVLRVLVHRRYRDAGVAVAAIYKQSGTKTAFPPSGLARLASSIPGLVHQRSTR